MTTSWIIVRKSDNYPVLETWSEKVKNAINREKYTAIPIMEYLQSLNKQKGE